MIYPHRHTKFKEGHEKALLAEYQLIRVRLQLVLEDMSAFCEAQGQEMVLTDLMSEATEDAALKRVSTSHQEGRAADVRIKNWPEWFKQKFEVTFEARYPHYAAVSKTTMQPQLIVYHDNGNGTHAHIQIKNYKESI